MHSLFPHYLYYLTSSLVFSFCNCSNFPVCLLPKLHELYKLRSLPDLVEVTTEGNPMCSLPHERQITTFLLRSLEILNGDQITDKDRIEADERFQQGL